VIVFSAMYFEEVSSHGVFNLFLKFGIKSIIGYIIVEVEIVLKKL